VSITAGLLGVVIMLIVILNELRGIRNELMRIHQDMKES
jgi:hypothetical protein